MNPNPTQKPIEIIPVPPKKGTPTWVIVLIVLGVGGPFIGGTLLVLAIYGVRKYIQAAKQVEARNSVAMIAKSAAAAYEEDLQSDTVKLPAGKPHGPAESLCASASRSVPSAARYIRGAKYQSTRDEWAVDASHPRQGFACLKFSMDAPQYYMYSYSSKRLGAAGTFTATANGDLNGDGTLSTFSLTGQVGADGTLALDPTLHEEQPGE
jgi:type IV pilus assembly protein PilA